MAGVPEMAGIECQTDGQTGADVSEIKQIKEIVQREPECDGDGFENQPQDDGECVVFHVCDLCSFFFILAQGVFKVHTKPERRTTCHCDAVSLQFDSVK